MKRTLSLILAILMVVTIFATVGMAEDEPEAAGEPETVETAAPAAEEPAAPVEEAPAEPAPAAEPEVVPASEPAAEPVAEPNAEPATISEEPADNGIAPVSEPTPTAVPVVTWVELDCNGGSYKGYTRFSADVFDGKLHSNLTPVREGYTFVGWYKDKPNDNPDASQAIHDGGVVDPETTLLYAGWKPIPEPTKPSVTTDNYKYGVWLTVVNGKFEDDNAGKASVWVEFTDGTRKLPQDGLPKATRTNGEFEGWYTQPPTEELKDGYWTTVTKNGTKIEGETPVPEGVQVLYAAFTDKERQEESEKLVTFYLDWNGIDGRWGNCLTCTRPYTEGGYTLTPGDLLVRHLNWDGDDESTLLKFNPQKQQDLDDYWGKRIFNGYKFLGWSTTLGTQTADVVAGVTKVTNGQSIYAVWTKDDSSSSTFGRVDPEAGSITGMHIDAPHLTIRQDPSKPESVTIPLFVTPVGGTGTITWTVKVPPTVDMKDLSTAFKGETQTYTIVGDEITKADDGITKEEPNFTAKAEGLNLTIFPQKGCSQVLFVSAACGDVTTPADATVIIKHEVSEVKTVVKAATCTAAGEEGFVCSECGEVTGAETLPATGHSFCGQATCTVCGELGKKGDPSGDGIINTNDVRNLFLCAMNGGDGIAPEIGDVNGDGVINTNDVRVLFLAAMNDGSLPG